MQVVTFTYRIILSYRILTVIMDAIKKKMQSLKTETENAMARADQLDAEFRAATSLAEKTEETVNICRTIKRWPRKFLTLGKRDSLSLSFVRNLRGHPLIN